MGYFRTFPSVWSTKTKAEKQGWYILNEKMVSTSEDGSFYNEMGTLKDGIEKYYGREISLLMKLWIIQITMISGKKRDLLPHLKNIKHAGDDSWRLV